MKIGIVGAGAVGAAAAYAMVLRGSGSELVIIDQNHEKAQAEAADISHATPMSHPLRVYAGQYTDLSGSRVVALCAGVNQKPGESRLELLRRNAEIFREVVPRLLSAAPDAVLLVATNPVDLLTGLVADLAGPAWAGRVIGSGTVLDTARLRTLLAALAGVDPGHVHGYVLGEHGDSEVIAWSGARVAGLPLGTFMQATGKPWDAEIQARTERDVRGAAARIIAVKGATAYGIGAALARITEAILRDRRSVLSISAPHPGYGVSLSLPRVLGGAGILQTLPLDLTPGESAALQRSAGVLVEAAKALR